MKSITTRERSMYRRLNPWIFVILAGVLYIAYTNLDHIIQLDNAEDDQHKEVSNISNEDDRHTGVANIPYEEAVTLNTKSDTTSKASDTTITNVKAQISMTSFKNPETRKTEFSANLRLAENQNINPQITNNVLDFAHIGFPKTGSTSMARWLVTEESYLPEKEECALMWEPKGEEWMRDMIAHREEHPTMKHGIKCPNWMYSSTFSDYFTTFFPRTDLIIGIRHPVLWFQSFYNFRVKGTVTGKHAEPLEDIPNPKDLMGNTTFKGVNVDGANFALPMSKLGKTKLDSEELELLTSMSSLKNKESNVEAVTQHLEHTRSNAPQLGRVFLYDLEQREDTNNSRRENFVEDLGKFLKLKEPLPPERFRNHRNYTNPLYNELKMEICDDEYIELRARLLEIGAETSTWLIRCFINSEDVVVSSRGHLISILETYSVDPCSK